jgi:hypothetical protein
VSTYPCSQADTEQGDIELERKELKADDLGEHKELGARGDLGRSRAQVAQQLMAHDANTRNVLGRNTHGDNRRSWGTIRNSDIRGAIERLPQTRLPAAPARALTKRLVAKHRLLQSQSGRDTGL